MLISHRWPLALRFVKGAIHSTVIVPVAAHALFAAAIVYIDQNLDHNLGLPGSIVGFAASGLEDFTNSLTGTESLHSSGTYVGMNHQKCVSITSLVLIRLPGLPQSNLI